MKSFVIAIVVIFAIQHQLSCEAIALDHFKLLDLKVGNRQFTGRVLTHDDRTCWLLRRDGRMDQIAMDQVSAFSEAGDRFQAHSQSEIKSQLQTEFGKTFEVRTSTHYVVVASRGRGDTYVTAFDQIYRECVRALGSRGFTVERPEFPLIAIVFPDHASYSAYCQSEGIRAAPGMVGYYLASSNRVAMYERPDATEMDSTVIHEATHQVAFNTGIHSRVARHPWWVVEGLATVFEADGVRTRREMSTPVDRVNRERHLWFAEYSRKRRVVHSLEKFVRDDKVFETAVLDAYSEAWALSFFLIETRSTDYGKYLRTLVARDPLAAYDADARLNDFTNAFGSDLDGLETSYLKFMRRIGN